MEAIITFEKTLDNLENALLTPVIPGELVDWLGILLESARSAQGLIGRQIDGVHKPDLEQMAKREPELLSHVAQLRQADTDNLARLKVFLERIGQLKHKAAQIGPDEGALKNGLDALTEEGLAWMISARRQERAVETWFAQSFNRDIGVGD